MSFRGDDRRRYGQVPPVQYPVAGQPAEQHQQQHQHQHQHQQHSAVGRRPSFNNGDDGAYLAQTQDRPRAYGGYAPATQAEDELFLGGSNAGRPAYSSTNNALAGYQHQYQDPTPPTPSQSAYNPQTFAHPAPYQRQNIGLPYHPSPHRYPSNSSSYNSPAATNYTPQTYNPAAYASTATPQRQSTYHGHNYQDQNYNSLGISQTSPSFAPSPGTGYSPAFSQGAPSPALSGYQQSLPSPSYSSTISSQAQTPSYDPSLYGTSSFPGFESNGGSPGQSPYSGASQAPYPATSHIPVGPAYSANEPASYLPRHSRSGSQSSAVSPPAASSAASGLYRHPTNAPLPSRPMEDVPEEPSWNTEGQSHHNNYNDEYASAESIMQDIEAELGRRQSHRQGSPNGRNSETSSITYADNQSSRYRYESDDDDDPEGTAGVLAMQQAELEDRRFSSTNFLYNDTQTMSTSTLAPPAEEQGPSSDSDVGGTVDLSMLGGGYSGSMSYGNQVQTAHNPPTTVDGARPLPVPGYTQPLHGRSNSHNSHNSHQGRPGTSSAFDNAEVDYGGTGGLQPPRPHRLSFDEGDERVSLHSLHSGTDSPTKDDYQDLFYHPGLSNRPLPAVPPGPGSDSGSMTSPPSNTRPLYSNSVRSTDSTLYQPETPEAYYHGAAQQVLQPERSISLSGHSNTPQVQAPARSRTDATEDRKKVYRNYQHPSNQTATFSQYEPVAAAPIGAFDGITLPDGRKKKFIPSKLNAAHYRRCVEPWALSGIEAWVREMAEGELDLRGKTVEDALTMLFTAKVPTMNVADAEALGSRVVDLMLAAGTLVPDEEWVKFGEGHISGVLWQLTGSGCYSAKVHDVETTGRCYSYHCTRTLKKVDLDDLAAEGTKPTDEWHVFYGLKKEDWESRPKKEVDRQNILHEIVTGEENYIKQLDIFRTLYRDQLRAIQPPIIQPDRRDKFLAAVFGKLDTVLRINKEHLLSQLKYRQQEQGPWITGFSDLFREWIRKAKSDYIEYATGYPHATYMVRKEANRNILFKKFLEDKQKHRSSSKQDWTHFLIAPLQRLQRYILLLESVEHKMIGDSEEKTNLQKAIEEIKVVTQECDAKVAETNKRVEMMELDRMLVLRPGFQSVLNLDHLGRELLLQGELQRMGSKGVRWVDTHALLFDHYLILAKVVVSKDGRGERKYDVSREPIPMPLLFLESMNDEPLQKQKGITAPLGRTTTASSSGTQLNKVGSNGSSRPGLEHTATSSSIGSTHLTPNQTPDTEGKILYPFRVKHLGHEVYTLYALTARDRSDWCTKIIEAKTRHAKALFSQNAEPFRLRVLADAAFNYEASSPYARTSGVPVKGTPLDRAIQDLEKVLGPAQIVNPICRAQVNCACAFSAFGKSILAIGTDYGVYITDPSNPRGWIRSVQITRVTQIAVLEEFSVCLLIADKSLISYPLDVIAPVSDFAPPVNDNPRRAPVRLAKDVTYFATARMKDRTLVFYKRKEGLHTSFKVLEPIFNKSTEKKTRLFGGRKAGGSTESFRDYDEFFFPTECYSLSLFQTYIAVATSKGIEMLTLDKKHPMSIPDLKAPAIANIASRIRDQRPLGMFRLNENEFILTYEDCAVYVDKHGEVSRTLIMEYTGKQKKAKGATMYGQYLLLFNEDYVEIRNAENGRLRQIIAGRDVRVIDYGVRGPTGGNAALTQAVSGQNGQLPNLSDATKGTVKIAMSHPELQGRQIVLEMLLNDGHTEK